MRRKITTITDVAEYQLCAGCGACASVAPDRVEMVDDLDRGRRPVVAEGARSDDLLEVCPGVGVARSDRSATGSLIDELYDAWGPVMAVYEGAASDAEVRLAASSGGAATALAMHGIESAGAHGVLHIGARSDIPWLNETVLSIDRQAMLDRTGSRYAPASPCDRLDLVESSPGPVVFIGKPCDVAALAKVRRIRPEIDDRIAFTIAIFCAGTPNTRATLELIDELGGDAATGDGLRYRGNGWPGNATFTNPDGSGDQMSYEESWGRLQAKRQWRCYVCMDHTGEHADVSVGDPWYRDIPDGEPGQSLVLARTPLGRSVVEEARSSGHLSVVDAEQWKLPASQPNLLADRGAVWGRMSTTRAMGVATPRHDGMSGFGFWRSELGAKAKAQAFYGTVKRVFTKQLRKRHPVNPYRGGRDPNA